MACDIFTPNNLFCKVCSLPFAKRSGGSGGQKKYCSDDCKRAAWNKCSVNGCNKRARSFSSNFCNACYTSKAKREAGVCAVHKCEDKATRKGGLCEKHYYRVRRNGSHHLTPRVFRQEASGYNQVKDQHHPLATSNGWVYEHRKIAYDKYGDGKHGCHWCGVQLQWSEAVVDHLDNVKDNNCPDNLVFSCSPCNMARGAIIPFVKRLTKDGYTKFVQSMEFMRD